MFHPVTTHFGISYTNLNFEVATDLKLQNVRASFNIYTGGAKPPPPPPPPTLNGFGLPEKSSPGSSKIQTFCGDDPRPPKR